MIAVWTIEGKALGVTELGPDVFDRLHLYPWSFAAFCPHCGRVWATIKVEGAREFYPRLYPCQSCPALVSGEISGSLYMPWNHGFDEAMPDALVEREYLLHLAYYERITHERDTLEQKAA